jgi:serine/threonine protein kinase
MKLCKAKTQTGNRCKRKLLPSNQQYCWQHRRSQRGGNYGYQEVLELIDDNDDNNNDDVMFITGDTIRDCISPLKLGEYLSRGHFGSVSEACMMTDCSKYVVKVQKWTDQLQSLIQNEVTILDRIQRSQKSHIMPKYVKACKAGAGLFVIVMERVDGSILSRGFLTKQETHTLMDLIEDLHSLNIVHYDIKWSNILYSRSKARLYLADFAISRVIFDPFTFRKQQYFDWLYLATSLILNDLPLPPRLMEKLREYPRKHLLKRLGELIAASIKGRKKRKVQPLMTGLTLQALNRRLQNLRSLAKTTKGQDWTSHGDRLAIHVMGANDIL